MKCTWNRPSYILQFNFSFFFIYICTHFCKLRTEFRKKKRVSCILNVEFLSLQYIDPEHDGQKIGLNFYVAYVFYGERKYIRSESPY